MTKTAQSYPAIGDKVHNAFSFQSETWIVTDLARGAEWSATKAAWVPHRFPTVILENQETGDVRTLERCSAKDFWRNWRPA